MIDGEKFTIDSILFPKNNCICGKAAYKSDGKRCLEKKTNRGPTVHQNTFETIQEAMTTL